MYDTRRPSADFEQGLASSRPARSPGSLLPVLVVLGFGLLVIVGLIGLAGLAGLYIILALAGVLGFAAFHYVLWGWWLTGKLREQEESERADADE